MGSMQNGEWPYHENAHGEWVKCGSNPCRRHSGGDIMARDAEDAYAKANAARTAGGRKGLSSHPAPGWHAPASRAQTRHERRYDVVDVNGVKRSVDGVDGLRDMLEKDVGRDRFAYMDGDGGDHTTGEVIDSLLSKLDNGDDASEEEATLGLELSWDD